MAIIENAQYKLIRGDYSRGKGKHKEIIHEGDIFRPTVKELRLLRSRVAIVIIAKDIPKKVIVKSTKEQIDEKLQKRAELIAKVNPKAKIIKPAILHENRKSWEIKPEHKGLWRTNYRNPYQDVRIHGETVYLGQRDCESRYQLMKPYMEKLGKGFKMLDIGAAQGYFDFRAAEDFEAKCTLIDRDDCLDKIVAYNNYPGFVSYNRWMEAEEIAQVIDDDDFDCIVSVSVIHNIKDWKPIAEALMRAVKRGVTVFIETPLASEGVCMNADICGDILNYLSDFIHIILGHTLDRDLVSERPMLVFKNKFKIPGTPKTGSGNASKHEELWSYQTERVTGEKFINGTLNLILPNKLHMPKTEGKCEWFPIQIGKFYLWKCKLNGYPCWIAKPPHSSWGEEYPELMGDVRLREYLDIDNNSSVELEVEIEDDSLDNISEGIVKDGLGKSKEQLGLLRIELEKCLGTLPYPGSLNIRLNSPIELPKAKYRMQTEAGEYRFYPVKISNGDLEADGFWMRPPLSKTQTNLDCEVLSDIYLREKLQLETGSKVTVELLDCNEAVRLDLSIVTSLYGNYWKYLPRWAESICNLNRKPSSVTVVISGHEVFSKADVTWFQNVSKMFNEAGINWKYIKIDEHIGMGRGRNTAVEQTYSEWIIYLDADDIIKPDALDEIAHCARKSDLVCTGLDFDGVRVGQRPLTFFKSTPEAILKGQHCSSSHSAYRKCLWIGCKYIEANDYVDTALWVGFAHQHPRMAATLNICTTYMSRSDGHYLSLSTKEKAAAREQSGQLRQDPELFKKLLLTEKSKLYIFKSKEDLSYE